MPLEVKHAHCFDPPNVKRSSTRRLDREGEGGRDEKTRTLASRATIRGYPLSLPHAFQKQLTDSCRLNGVSCTPPPPPVRSLRVPSFYPLSRVSNVEYSVALPATTCCSLDRWNMDCKSLGGGTVEATALELAPPPTSPPPPHPALCSAWRSSRLVRAVTIDVLKQQRFSFTRIGIGVLG